VTRSLPRLLGAVVAGLLLACRPQAAPQPAEGPVFFPLPPDAPRIQFLTRFSSSDDVVGSGRSFWEGLAGAERRTADAIVKPYGVALHRGRLYVCDTMLPGVDIFDLTARAFRRFQPRGEGLLRKPINCFVDERTGHLYVADTDRGQVVEYDWDLRYVGAFGEAEGARPADVFVDGDYAWVADLAEGRILVYDKGTRRLVRIVPGPDTDSAAALRQPTNLYVRDGFVYVSEFTDFRVKVFTTDGAFVRSVGVVGTGRGQFARPKGIAVDTAGVLYVVDAAFENVQMFDRSGQLLMHFGGAYQGPGYLYLPAKVIVDYDDVDLFRGYVDPRFDLDHLILVTNQYGPDKVSVYGFVRPKEAPNGAP
jgi:DNA-binding beta-propeller fold protein YncE